MSARPGPAFRNLTSWLFLSVSRCVDFSRLRRSGLDEEPSGEEAVLRQIQIRFNDAELEKISSAWQDNLPQVRKFR